MVTIKAAADMLPSFGGDNLAARASPLLNQMLGIFALILAGVIIAVIAINQVRKVLHLNDAGDRIKHRVTTSGDIKGAAETFSLDVAESSVLTEICHMNKVVNINYTYLDAEATYALFKKSYKHFEGRDKLTPFFSLFEKINRVRLVTNGARTTGTLKEKQTVYVLDPRGPRYPTTLLERDKDTMTLTAPKNAQGETVRLKDIARVTIMAEDINNSAMTAGMRVLRYQNRQGREELVLMQTNNVQTFIKQDYTYVECRAKMTWSKCEEGPNETGNSESPPFYSPASDPLPGLFLNYCAKNCNLVLGAPAAGNDLLTIRVTFPDGTTGELVVQVQTVVPQTKGFLAHGKFVYVNDRTKNYMLARINGFGMDN